MDATHQYYDSFKRSVNTGILRRNTVFQGQSVNGYSYFPVEDWNFEGYARDHRFKHQLRLEIPGDVFVAAFEPIEGE
jgi:hypothetical protein